MGGKRTRRGQYLYLYIAGLMLLVSSSCAVPAKTPGGGEECARLHSLQPLIDGGEFERAVRKSEDILAASPSGPHADEALYALGLVYAHAGNPKKDYRKSRDYFARLVKQFPHSSLTGEARIWTGVLDMFEKTKEVDIEIEGKKKSIVK
ncbi:MAG TPA: tetratricopeptide repeat protein [Nitrospirota bacterium]|nr:tetratricopeptide repeat protein [Nitrospirota bacterium]